MSLKMSFLKKYLKTTNKHKRNVEAGWKHPATFPNPWMVKFCKSLKKTEHREAIECGVQKRESSDVPATSLLLIPTIHFNLFPVSVTPPATFYLLPGPYSDQPENAGHSTDINILRIGIYGVIKSWTSKIRHWSKRGMHLDKYVLSCAALHWH